MEKRCKLIQGTNVSKTLISDSAFGVSTLLAFLRSKPSVWGWNQPRLQYGDVLINEVKIAIWLKRPWQFINMLKSAHLSPKLLLPRKVTGRHSGLRLRFLSPGTCSMPPAPLHVPVPFTSFGVCPSSCSGFLTTTSPLWELGWSSFARRIHFNALTSRIDHSEVWAPLEKRSEASAVLMGSVLTAAPPPERGKKWHLLQLRLLIHRLPKFTSTCKGVLPTCKLP